MRKPVLISFLLLLFLNPGIVPPLADVSAESPSETPPAALDVSTVTIPPHEGAIIHTYPAKPVSRPEGDRPVKSAAPLIVQIQEAHSDGESQRHLAAILEDLVKRYGLRLILVEGGDGDVSVSHFRAYGSVPRRKQVAEKYLKAGILNGEEYLELVSEYPLILWGIEDRELYQRNWQALQEADAVRGSFAPFLIHVRQALQQLQPSLFSAPLNELEAMREAFEHDAISVTVYIDWLAHLALQQQIDLSTEDELWRVMSLSRQERALDLTSVQRDQQALLGRLQQLTDAAVFAPVIAKANAVNAGTLSQEAFYETLTTLAAGHGVDLKDYPQLANYLAYLKAPTTIHPEQLSQQLERATTTLRTALSGVSPESQRLMSALDELVLVERLVSRDLSAEEYQRFRSLSTPGLLCGWEQFIEERSRQYRLDIPTLQSCGTLEAALPSTSAFYEVAVLRDHALVDRAIRKLEESGEPLAALIMGGFHARAMAQEFQARGMAVVVVTPTMTQPANPDVYEAVLKYKRGLLPLHQVMAMSRSSTTSGGSTR